MRHRAWGVPLRQLGRTSLRKWVRLHASVAQGVSQLGCVSVRLPMALGSLAVTKPMRMLTRRLVRPEFGSSEIRSRRSGGSNEVRFWDA